jgi:tetratricopeptide (TPR) repeat protein
MPRIEARIRWRVPLALATVLTLFMAGAGFWWVGIRRSSGPLGPGLDAYARGDWEKAAGVARARLREAADDITAARLLARASVQLGRDASALTLFDRLGPAVLKAEDFYLLGVALARTGNSASNVEVWEQGLRSDPDHPDHPETLAALVRVYLEQERFEAAVAAARRLAQQPGWRAEADVLLGRLQADQGDPAGAVESYRQALGPSSVDRARPLASGPEVTRKELTRALLRVRRPAEARDELRSILARGPDAEASWLLSRAYLQEGALPQAQAALKEAGSFGDEDPTLPDPAPFVGADRCAECHREKFEAQRHSRHARTFHRASQLEGLTLPRPAFPDPVEPAVTHTLHRVGDRMEYEVHTPERIFKAIVDYAFGSGDRGKTLVGRETSGPAFELRLSVYHEGNQSVWDVTSGQPEHPAVALGFLGMPLKEDAARACLGCHVTNPGSLLGTPGPEAADPAIGCEKCHGPGGNHLLAAAARFPELAIARPSLASGRSVVKICAQCHSPHGKAVSRDDPTAVRFQGATLTWSRCYTESGDRLDCTTCHDPHRDASTSPAYYEAKCLSCHAGGDQASAKIPAGVPVDSTRSRTCPVNPSRGCISCHMPSVQGAMAHSPFTDHFIRVHPPSAPTGGG